MTQAAKNLERAQELMCEVVKLLRDGFNSHDASLRDMKAISDYARMLNHTDFESSLDIMGD